MRVFRKMGALSGTISRNITYYVTRSQLDILRSFKRPINILDTPSALCWINAENIKFKSNPLSSFSVNFIQCKKNPQTQEKKHRKFTTRMKTTKKGNKIFEPLKTINIWIICLDIMQKKVIFILGCEIFFHPQFKFLLFISSSTDAVLKYLCILRCVEIIFSFLRIWIRRSKKRKKS